jgi:hypothetical protein
MSGGWFANRGQILQAVAALVSACVAAAALYFVLKNNNSLPKASVIFYASGAILLLLVGVFLGRRLANPPAPTLQKKPQFFISSSGMSFFVSADRRRVDFQFMVLSSVAAELVHVTAEARTREHVCTFVDAEPVQLSEMIQTQRNIEAKLEPRDIAKMSLSSIISLDGWATFRHGSQAHKIPIHIATVAVFR